jgi:ADP-ribose pyrophosphatase YjhB (NUDIX family)
MVNKFNIRVYGIWIKDQKILLSHENIDGFKMTKLPGGGLELGEGPLDAIHREFQEELNIELSSATELFVTDGFIQSTFRKNEQIVAIHYLVESMDYLVSHRTEQKTNVGRSNKIRFEWKDLNDALIDILSFEIDKTALRKYLNTRRG